jgi:hypothetical protein
MELYYYLLLILEFKTSAKKRRWRDLVELDISPTRLFYFFLSEFLVHLCGRCTYNTVSKSVHRQSIQNLPNFASSYGHGLEESASQSAIIFRHFAMTSSGYWAVNLLAMARCLANIVTPLMICFFRLEPIGKRLRPRYTKAKEKATYRTS